MARRRAPRGWLSLGEEIGPYTVLVDKITGEFGVVLEDKTMVTDRVLSELRKIIQGMVVEDGEYRDLLQTRAPSPQFVKSLAMFGLRRVRGFFIEPLSSWMIENIGQSPSTVPDVHEAHFFFSDKRVDQFTELYDRALALKSSGEALLAEWESMRKIWLEEDSEEKYGEEE